MMIQKMLGFLQVVGLLSILVWTNFHEPLFASDDQIEKAMLQPRPIRADELLTSPIADDLSLSNNSTDKPKEVPYWTQKRKSFLKKSPPPEDNKICLVHVGKTAGSTLACYLGFRYTCSGENYTSEGILPQYTTNLIHTSQNDCLNDEFAYYLYTLRNPMDRIISWFAYEHPSQSSNRSKIYYQKRKLLFIDCYSTLEELAVNGLGGDRKSACSDRAWEAIQGDVAYVSHNYYNFGYYRNQVEDHDPKGRIIAIRTEHLMEDWNSIEDMLGGHPMSKPLSKRNASRKRSEVEKISDQARRNLCVALRQEIQVYKDLLERAENLSEEQVAESLREVRESCPDGTSNLQFDGPLLASDNLIEKAMLEPHTIGADEVLISRVANDLPLLNKATDKSKEVPYWTQKRKSFLKKSSPPEDNKICLVHVGKTAGSTLACYFGFRYPCSGKNYTSEGILPKYTTNLMHTKHNDCQNDEFAYYLYTLRNPMDRIISWFAYERPGGPSNKTSYLQKKLLFVDCYSTLEELAANGLGGDRKSACSDRAWEAIQGDVGYSAHNYYNFGYYRKQVEDHDPKGRIIAIRTEHLMEDWNSIEDMLGGHPMSKPLNKINVSQKRSEVEKISDQARRNLCVALRQEIQVYKDLLERAENLSEKQVAESLRELQESCPDGTSGEKKRERPPIANDLSLSNKATDKPRKVPYWAQKRKSFLKKSPPPEDNKICLVHVGKTAGSTLACYLGFRYPCSGENYIPRGILPKYTTNLMHVKHNDCRNDDFAYYLYTLRNPMDRIISWFAYERPDGPSNKTSYLQRKLLFVDCYSTLEELAVDGLEGDRKSTCSNRAWEAIQGEVGYGAHNYYNFGYYRNQVEDHDPKGRIIAIRAEHLKEDWNSIEDMLGGHPMSKPLNKINVSQKRSEVEKISDRARQNLCVALRQEIQVYKNLLERAENLSEEQVAESLREVRESCPDGTSREKKGKGKERKEGRHE